MNLDTIDQTDPTFAADLLESQRAVFRVAAWLNARGLRVSVPPIHVRATPADMSEYADDGDLEVSIRVEVKRRGFEFTSAADYPYPSVLVCNVHTWEKAKTKPAMVVILNHAGTHAALVRRHTFRKWSTMTRQDRGRDRTFYMCPIAAVEFCALEDR